ncbi:hypothetical protein HOLleu_33908 [Holothuria leucospilota]|uniref:PH domain-containing protein n=1 Tax=Holothuria leucospilota TaxID=206669 RepID=A0A9Q1BHH4_HOLLE|nr:hypothetical protein HOLleu_33908 [Holothuria leucospilota]
MGDLVPVHERLQRFFSDIDFDFPTTKVHKRVSVQWLHSKYLLHEGYLRKKAPHRQNKWQRRYTMLYGHHVFYFKSVKSKMPKGWFSLRAYDKVFEEFGDDPQNRKFCIKLKNSRNNDIRVFCFEVATFADLKMWKSSFQAIIDFIHNSGLIKDSCQEHILKIKAIPPDLTPDILRKPEYSIMMDSRVSEPDLSRLARSLGRGWKSFAREKLCIPQNELDKIREENNSREDEVYAVLLQWRRRERDNATKRKLIGLLRDFCDEIDYCEWEFLERSDTHDYLNEDMDNDEDSSDGDGSDRDVYDDVEPSSQRYSNDLFNVPAQDEDFECQNSEDEVLPNMQDYPPPRVDPSHPYLIPKDQQTGVTPPAKPVPPRQRLHSEPRHTTDQTPGPVLPHNNVPSGTWRMHGDLNHADGKVPGPALPPRPRPPVESRLQPHVNPHRPPLERPPTLPRRSWAPESGPPPPVHFSLNENTNQWTEAPPPLPPSPPPPPPRIQHVQNNSNQLNTPQPPPISRSLPRVNAWTRPHNTQQENMVQGRLSPPRRPPPVAGADLQRNPLFQRPRMNSTFAAELEQVLRR